MSDTVVRGAIVRTRPARRPWVAIGLTISLAVNLFLLAAIAGTVVSTRTDRAEMGRFERVAHRLQLTDQQETALQQLLRTMREQGKSMRLANQALMDKIGEVNADKAQVEALLARTVRNRTNFQMETASDLSQFILSLSAEQRAKFIEGLRTESQERGIGRLIHFGGR